MSDCCVITAPGREELTDAWWHFYQASGTRLPVCFVHTFGMSKARKDWCRARGTFIDLESVLHRFLIGKFVGAKHRKLMQGWWSKPFAMLAAPTDKFIWLDQDVAVRAPLDSLVQQIQPGQIHTVFYPPEHSEIRNKKRTIHGVVAAHTKNPVLQQWLTWHQHQQIADDEKSLYQFRKGDMSCCTDLGYEVFMACGHADAEVTHQMFVASKAPLLHYWGTKANKDLMVRHAKQGLK